MTTAVEQLKKQCGDLIKRLPHNFANKFAKKEKIEISEFVKFDEDTLKKIVEKYQLL